MRFRPRERSFRGGSYARRRTPSCRRTYTRVGFARPIHDPVGAAVRVADLSKRTGRRAVDLLPSKTTTEAECNSSVAAAGRPRRTFFARPRRKNRRVFFVRPPSAAARQLSPVSSSGRRRCDRFVRGSPYKCNTLCIPSETEEVGRKKKIHGRFWRRTAAPRKTLPRRATEPSRRASLRETRDPARGPFPRDPSAAVAR